MPVLHCRASSTVAFSLIAHKCTSCGSYNTRRMGVIPGSGYTPGAAALGEGALGVGDGEHVAVAAAAAAQVAVNAPMPNFAMVQAMQAMLGEELHGDEDDEEDEVWEDAQGGIAEEEE